MKRMPCQLCGAKKTDMVEFHLNGPKESSVFRGFLCTPCRDKTAEKLEAFTGVKGTRSKIEVV